MTSPSPVLFGAVEEAPPGRTETVPSNSFSVNRDSPVPTRRNKLRKRQEFRWAARRYNHHVFGDNYRVGKCGRYTISGTTAIKRKTNDEGGVFVSGMQQCASIHACPPCAAKIRAKRAQQIDHTCKQHLNAGGGLTLLTVTLPHDLTDKLGDIWQTVSTGWTKVIGGSPFHGKTNSIGAKQKFGILGFIRAFDLTHSERSGWHPHLHILIFTKQPQDIFSDEYSEFKRWFHHRWTKQIEKLTGRHVDAGFGIQFDPVKNQTGIGKYVSKVNFELARSDLKQGRGYGSRTPFQILADAMEDGDAADRDLWVEFFHASFGRVVITTSQQLRKLYPVSEQTDDEIVSEEHEGEVVVLIDHRAWRLLLGRYDNLIARFLHTLQTTSPHTAFLQHLQTTGLYEFQMPPPTGGVGKIVTKNRQRKPNNQQP